jgi:hypothetical protein
MMFMHRATPVVVKTASHQRQKTGTAKASRADTARVARYKVDVGNALSDLARSAGGALPAQHPLFADYASVISQDMTSDPYFPSSTHDCAMDPAATYVVLLQQQQQSLSYAQIFTSSRRLIPE